MFLNPRRRGSRWASRSWGSPAGSDRRFGIFGSSITSAGPPYDRFAACFADNPHVHFFDSRRRGYVSVDLRPQRMEVAFRAISDPADSGAEVTTLQRFVVADGKPGPVTV